VPDGDQKFWFNGSPVFSNNEGVDQKFWFEGLPAQGIFPAAIIPVPIVPPIAVIPKTLVAVEIDLHDGTVVETLRLASGLVPLAATVDGVRVQYDPRLYVPLQFGTRISGEQYGEPLRGEVNAGQIDFALDETIWPKLEYHWKGRALRVYLAAPGDDHDDFELVFTGRVDELTHDTLTGKIKTLAGIAALDGPIVSDLYGDDAPEALRGRPKPELRGERKCIAPTLIDGVAQIYQVSRLPLAEITEVRVGGVPWQEAASPPGDGEWSADLAAGKFQLGQDSLGMEVRCDARGADWATLTTAALMTALVTEAGGTVDTAAMAALDAAAPYLIGFYTGTDPVNRFDGFDRIMGGLGGWWTERMVDGAVTAGVQADTTTASRTLTALSIGAANQTQLVPPAWRIRIEHSGNEHPQTNFPPDTAVSEADQQKWRSTGIAVVVFEDASIKTAEPLAVDVPLIPSLVNNEADALSIGARLIPAWTVARKLYEVVDRDNLLASDEMPALYDTIGVQYRMINAVARVHSVLRSVGGGANAVQLWSEQLPTAALYAIAHPGALTEDDGFAVLFEDDVVTPLTEDA